MSECLSESVWERVWVNLSVREGENGWECVSERGKFVRKWVREYKSVSLSERLSENFTERVWMKEFNRENEGKWDESMVGVRE